MNTGFYAFAPAQQCRTPRCRRMRVPYRETVTRLRASADAANSGRGISSRRKYGRMVDAVRNESGRRGRRIGDRGEDVMCIRTRTASKSLNQRPFLLAARAGPAGPRRARGGGTILPVLRGHRCAKAPSRKPVCRKRSLAVFYGAIHAPVTALVRGPFWAPFRAAPVAMAARERAQCKCRRKFRRPRWPPPIVACERTVRGPIRRTASESLATGPAAGNVHVVATHCSRGSG